MNVEISRLVEENNRRKKEMREGFDPLTGKGAVGERRILEIEDFPIPVQHLPIGAFKNALIKAISKEKSVYSFIENVLKEEYSEEVYNRVVQSVLFVRSKYDFCFWAYFFVLIKPKSGADVVPFKLRNEQRILLREMEDMRLSNKPIRIILLKARQWGGSTLVQIYMAWIQLLHKSGWYSTIVAQNKDVSRKIKAMYTKLLENYPPFMLDVEGEKLKFSPYEGSASDFIVTIDNGSEKARDTVVTIGTYENPDGTRGGDTALVHYSEVAMWNETTHKKPEDLIRSITGGLLNSPLTVEVLESTANGTGNFFHREWLRAKNGESSRRAVFVAWYNIEHDSTPVDNEEEFAEWLLENKNNDAPPKGYLDSGQYHWYMWEKGATCEGIKW